MKKRLPLIAAALLAAFVSPAVAVETGSAAPEFTLTDTAGTEHSLSDFKGKYVVLEWLNHSCPFVKKHYGSGNMQALQKKWADKGVVWLSVNSTNPDHGQYTSPEQADELTEKHGAAPTAVLMDPDGTVGKSYEAKTTPHMYVIDPDGVLIYQGAIDSVRSSKPEDIEGADNYVDSALTAAMAGDPVATGTTRPYGCSVKYP